MVLSSALFVKRCGSCVRSRLQISLLAAWWPQQRRHQLNCLQSCKQLRVNPSVQGRWYLRRCSQSRAGSAQARSCYSVYRVGMRQLWRSSLQASKHWDHHGIDACFFLRRLPEGPWDHGRLLPPLRSPGRRTCANFCPTNHWLMEPWSFCYQSSCFEGTYIWSCRHAPGPCQLSENVFCACIAVEPKRRARLV